MIKLLKEFKDMRSLAIFEIEDNEGEEYHIFYINATCEGLEAGGACNVGFLHIDKEALSVQWDDCFSLDEHLQELNEKCINYVNNNEAV